MKPGDKAMLVGTTGFKRRLHITEVEVQAVHKNGLVILKGQEQKYRASDGRPAGKTARFSSPVKLQPWSDDLWQKFQMEQQNADEATRLWDFGRLMVRIANSDEALAAEIWQSLPTKVRALIEKEGGN